MDNETYFPKNLGVMEGLELEALESIRKRRKAESIKKRREANKASAKATSNVVNKNRMVQVGISSEDRIATAVAIAASSAAASVTEKSGAANFPVSIEEGAMDGLIKKSTKSTFDFETDLTRPDIHPSGVIHAFRSTPSPRPHSPNRQEHVFAWIENCIHIDSAVYHLINHGFDCSDGMVFIPYSTKRNWVDRYPHAAPALECNSDGEVVLYLNWRPYPNGLGELGVSAARDDFTSNMHGKRKKQKEQSGILRRKCYISDAERDELHIEIYNYLKWFHGELTGLERKAPSAPAPGDNEEIYDGEKEESVKTRSYRGNCKVDVHELQGVLDKLESAFFLVPCAELDEVGPIDQPNDYHRSELCAGTQKEVPFLEEALGDALTTLVEAKKSRGEPRKRGRRKKEDRNPKKRFRCGFDIFVSEQKHSGSTTASRNNAWKSLPQEQRDKYNHRARCSATIGPGRGRIFDRIFQRLVQFKEDQGDILTSAQVEALRGLRSSGYDLFEHPDGINRRAPPNWNFGLKIRPMYILWHCGDEARRICPVKSWDQVDYEMVGSRRFRATKNELKTIMAFIDNAAVLNGVPPKKVMTQAEANCCFDAGKCQIPSVTPTGRLRNLENTSWISVVTYRNRVQWFNSNCQTEEKAPLEPVFENDGTSQNALETAYLDNAEKQQANFFRTAGVKQVASGNWQVKITWRKKCFAVGTYETQDQAALMNEVARKKLSSMADVAHTDEELQRCISLAKEAAEDAADFEKCVGGGKKKQKSESEETAFR